MPLIWPFIVAFVISEYIRRRTGTIYDPLIRATLLCYLVHFVFLAALIGIANVLGPLSVKPEKFVLARVFGIVLLPFLLAAAALVSYNLMMRIRK